MPGLKLNHLSDSGSRSIKKTDRTFDLNVVPFLAQYVDRKVLLLMVKRFTICDGFTIDRKIVVLTSFYNDRNTKNNRVPSFVWESRNPTFYDFYETFHIFEHHLWRGVSKDHLK